MKVTAWTNEEYARKHYRDLFEERLALLNPNKKALSPMELKRLAEEQNVPYGEFVKNWLNEYEKIPQFIDENKAKELMQIYREMEQTVIEHCKKRGIRFSSDYHQYGCGIPIIDNKYMFFCTLREWGRIMSECDDDYSDKGYLKYYLHGNEHPTKYPNEVGEICIE